MKHYKCVKCYFPRTNQVRDCDTVTLIPHEYPFLEVKLDNFFKQAENNISTLLSEPPFTTKNSLEVGYPTINSQLKIADTIKRLELLPPQAPLSDTVTLLRVKEVLTGTPLLMEDKKIKTNKNIQYPTTLTPQSPSTKVTNKYTSSADNTV